MNPIAGELVTETSRIRVLMAFLAESFERHRELLMGESASRVCVEPETATAAGQEA